jgi:hypothetical protein
MKRITMAVAALFLAGAFFNPARAERDLRNFGALGLGLAIPDDADFREDYSQRFCGALGYGTRLGHSERFFAYGMVGYNGFRAEEGTAGGDTRLWNLNADARWYFGVPTKEISGYVGLGPGVYWDRDGDAFIGANIAVGGDFPVDNDWSVAVDVDQHFVDSADAGAFLTIRVGAAYWFM